MTGNPETIHMAEKPATRKGESYMHYDIDLGSSFGRITSDLATTRQGTRKDLATVPKFLSSYVQLLSHQSDLGAYKETNRGRFAGR
jgi:hypothetical protein